MLKKRTTLAENANEQFIREALLTASLEHPNIMPVYDIGYDQNQQAFFTMKLSGEENLGEIIRKKGANLDDWPLSKRLNLFLRICDGVAYAHSRHILHLDLKPDNIQIGEFGEELICDWGLAWILFDEDEGNINPNLFNDTAYDKIKGTPGYMAPEQLNTHQIQFDRRTDIYALGGILYSLVTNKSPMAGAGLHTIISKTINGNIPSVRSLGANNDIPIAINAVIMKAMSLDPEDRYQEVPDLKEDIKSYLNGFATAAENVSFLNSLSLLIKRHRTLSLSLAFIFLLTIGFIARLRFSEQKAVKLSDLYTQEQNNLNHLKNESVPNLYNLALFNLENMALEETRNTLIFAESLSKNNYKTLKLLAEVNFSLHRFNEAKNYFEKISETDHQLYQLSVKYASLKNDQENLSTKDCLDIIKSLYSSLQAVRFAKACLNSKKANFKDQIHLYDLALRKKNRYNGASLIKFETYLGKNTLDLSGYRNFIDFQMRMLKGLKIHKLIIKDINLGQWELIHLAKVPLEEIDLRLNKPVQLDILPKIKTLKKITLYKNQYPEHILKKIPDHILVTQVDKE